MCFKRHTIRKVKFLSKKNYSRKSKLNFWTKKEDFEQCEKRVEVQNPYLF